MTEYDQQRGRDMPVDAGLGAAASDAADHDLAVALRGLSGVVAEVDALDDVLLSIAEYAKSSVPGTDGAGVTLIEAAEGAPRMLAWSVTDPFVREIDHLQYDICREGPCLTAMQTLRPLVSGSLGSDNRWPRFGGRVARLKVHSALALPLVIRGAAVGAINIYAYQRDAFTDQAVQLGARFAGPASVLVRNIQILHAARTKATQLQTALTSRATIDQAIGIIRSRSGGTAEEAFDRLRQISQAENVKLAVIAERLVDEAVRRAHARHGRA